MRILVVGCLHGNWELLTRTVQGILDQGDQIDLVLVNGDAETMRDQDDLHWLICPPKYRKMGTFYKLYDGTVKMPVLCVMTGGNHEVASLIYQLPFGGWIAPNVFFIGKANSFRFGSITISGISGIFNSKLYHRTCDETFPIQKISDMYSTIHYKSFSDFHLLGLSGTTVMCSHDWPNVIPSKYDPDHYLNKTRPDKFCNGHFGLPLGEKLIKKLKPKVWFGAHQHTHYEATTDGFTFIGLPRPPMENWFIVADIPGEPGELMIRGEWISILKATTEEMLNPSLLATGNWEERWAEKTLEPIPAQPIGEYSLDPIAQTRGFCEKYEISCPHLNLL